MKVGVIFPQTEIGPDPGAIREYAQTAEGLGYDHLVLFDHVLGADPEYYTEWKGYYELKDQFHEPFVTFGYIAAITSHIRFATAIIILPQRQTALVAKQAAEVDILTGGRLRLGIGIGWNRVEYEALGENFGNRGKRSEEQIALLRALWTQGSVDFHGKWHQITHAGINPLPVQRPIPIWLGGYAEAVLKRVARIGDGWFPNVASRHHSIPTTQAIGLDDTGRATIDRLHKYAREAGRDPSDIGIQGRIEVIGTSPADWAKELALWESLGATHVGFSTEYAGFRSVEEHIDAIKRFREILPRVGGSE